MTPSTPTAETIPLRWEDLRRLQKLAAQRDEPVEATALFLIHEGVYTHGADRPSFLP